ncbi:MAG: hypothetical protein ACREO3_06180 [Arenimonas sp.]
MRLSSCLTIAVIAALLLAGCGKDNAPATTTAATPDGATPAEPAKDDGGLFGFIGKDDEPAEPAMPDLGQFQVVAVALGTSLDADNNVRDAKTTFAPKDAIHAAVLSAGPHAGLTLAAHWTAADGTVVAHSEQALVPTGPTVTTFSLRNAQPWPPGMYQFALQVDGKILQSRAFEVVDPQATR